MQLRERISWVFLEVYKYVLVRRVEKLADRRHHASRFANGIHRKRSFRVPEASRELARPATSDDFSAAKTRPVSDIRRQGRRNTAAAPRPAEMASSFTGCSWAKRCILGLAKSRARLAGWPCHHDLAVCLTSDQVLADASISSSLP